MTAKQRRAAILIGRGGLTYAEIAKIVGCNLRTLERWASPDPAIGVPGFREQMRIARAEDAAFRALVARLRPAGTGLDSAELLAVNLVDGVVDARS